MTKFRTLPIIVSFMLIVQLFFPIIGVLAAEVQAPANLKIYERYPGSAVIEWDAVPYSSGYKVYRMDGDTKTLTSQPTTNKAFITLKEGTYSFAVSSIVNGSESPLSQPVSIEIIYPEMQAPGNIQSKIERFYDVTLSWDTASYVHYYKIYQVVDGVRKLVTTTEKTTHAFATLPEGHYVYEVTAYNSIFGESEQASRVELDIVYPDMEAPANLTYTIANGNDVTLSWSRSNHANKYNIYKVEDNKRTLVTSSTNLNVTLTNVPEGKHLYEVTSFSYTFKESVNAAGIEVNLVHPDVKAPGNLNLSITNGNDGALSWSKVDYATNYKIYQIIDESRVLLKQTTYQQLSLPNMEEGNYIFEVTAYSDRFGESLGARLKQQVIHPDMQKPEGFTGSVLNVDTLYLKWTKAEYATSYKLYQIINGERKFVSDINNTYTAINNLPEGDYVYEITSYSDRFGESAQASRVEATIVYPEIQAPNLQVYVNQEAKSIALWWDEVDYATSYDIYQVVDGERTLLQPTPNTRIVFNTMPYGKYSYEVVAHSKYGDSPFSNQVTASVEPILEAPTTPKASVKGDDVVLSWDPVKDAESYNVYEEVDGERVLVGNTSDPELTLDDREPGEHTYIIVPVSPTGKESSESTEIVVDVAESDTIAPVTESNVLVQWYQTEVAVELTATDDASGVASTFYSVNGAEFVEGASFVVSESGVNTVQFYSVDNAGNVEAVKTVEVKVDKAPPVTTSNVTDQWVKEFNVELSATDDFSGVDKTYYSVNGSEYVRGTSFVVSEPGVNRVSFFSVDKAGNKEEEQTIEVKIDTTAPETGSNVSNQLNQGEVAVTLTATDDLSGVAATYYSINGAEFVEGTTLTVTEAGLNEVSFYSMDNAGNVEEVKTAEVKVDNVAPETVSNVVNQWNQGEVAVTLTATDDLSGVAATYYSINGAEFVEGTTLTVTEAGVNEVSFYSVDNAGNVEEVKTAEVKVDNVAPETVSDVVEQWNQGEVAVTLTATDDLSGVAATYYSINGAEFVEGTTLTVTEAGVNEVSFYSVDNAGNVEEVKTAEVKVDNVAPETVSDVVEQWNQGEVAVTLTATDDLSGVAATYYSINGAEFVEGTTLTVIEAGVNEVSFYSVDNAGNVEEVKTVEVKIDTEAPKTVSDVVNQWNQGEVAVTLTATDDLSGVATTYYSINGAEFVEGTTLTVTEAGLNEVSFYSVDNAGNVEEVKTVEVKIDTMAPKTASDVSNQQNQGEVVVQLTATDDHSGVAATYYSINGAEFVEGTTVTVTEAGVNEVSFYSADNAGNVEDVKTIEVITDINAPETGSNVSDQWNQGEVAVELTARDAGSGVAATYYSVNGSEFVAGTAFTVTEEGINEVSFYSVDNAGNVEEVKTIEVKIDKTAPTVSIPLDSEISLGSFIQLDYLAEDNLSGITVEKMTLNGETYKKGDKVFLYKPGVNKLVVTVTDAAGWSTQVEKEFEIYISLELEVLPKVIKGNKGVFTVKADLPFNYFGFSYDVSTVTLNGVAADPKNKGLEKQAEKGHFKFEREDFDWEKGEVTLELRGHLDNGYLVIAKKTVQVK
ncbi:fibronectin type III domain-containing protein [Neobacillus sp. FSL H8-0543]|uniref:fibronectin type III domain-containing protein n=1 Tax=Neobacillus sp. FSL H8-0543 TaxID=2954672 RepID=UPI0031595989